MSALILYQSTLISFKYHDNTEKHSAKCIHSTQDAKALQILILEDHGDIGFIFQVKTVNDGADLWLHKSV